LSKTHAVHDKHANISSRVQPPLHLFPAGQQHQSSGWPRKDDAVLEHLLRDFRSAKLRKQFFNHDPKEYSETLDVKVLVRRAA
jgi:hypothetical protein